MGDGGALVNHLWLYFFILLSIFASSRSVWPDCAYTVYVKTGSNYKAGTDSNISMTLYDDNGFAFRIHNLVSWGGLMGPDYDYFERGNLDIFNGIGPCLTAPVCKVNLTSDGTGSDRGWYCQYVEATTTGVQKPCSHVEFAVEQWLAGYSLLPHKLSLVRDKCGKNKAVMGDSESSFILPVI